MNVSVNDVYKLAGSTVQMFAFNTFVVLTQPKLFTVEECSLPMMLRRVALVRNDLSDERSASIIRVTIITELGTALAGNSNRSRLRRNIRANNSYDCS
jgi:hypothetical protein